MAMLAPKRLPSIREWGEFFSSRGLREDLALEYLSYIRPLARRKVPVIFDADHLAALLGRTPYFLAKAASAPEYFYRTFQIPKRSGGMRTIASPYPSLKECQRWIADEILNRLSPGSSATAYVQGKSIRDHVEPHIDVQRSLLVVDLKNFFPSITKRRVIGFFRNLGYNVEVAIALASLCCLNGSLPQGSPASPMLSNHIALHLDRRILGTCNKFGLSYTRYADDICVSGKIVHSGVVRLVAQAANESGFALNTAKTRFFHAKSTAKIVTGVQISMGSLRLPRQSKRMLRHTMHFIDRFGYLSHRQKQKISDHKYLLRLRGSLEYWRFIEPSNAEVLEYIAKVAELQRIHGDC